LLAISVSVSTPVPVYTPSKELNVGTATQTVNVPLLAAVQRNQTDEPPALPACAGSPVSFVASAFVATTSPDSPVMSRAAAKVSLPGGTTRAWAASGESAADAEGAETSTETSVVPTSTRRHAVISV
jgi:hypothetical protein